MNCSICKLPINAGDVHIGTGDGSGSSFAHECCYYKQQVIEKDELLNKAKKKIKLLNKLLDECYQEEFSEFERG